MSYDIYLKGFSHLKWLTPGQEQCEKPNNVLKTDVQRMDLMVEIYETADDFRTQTYSNTNRQQPLQWFSGPNVYARYRTLLTTRVGRTRQSSAGHNYTPSNNLNFNRMMMAKNIFGNRNMPMMQVIDTEDVGEMTVYANVDDMNSHGHACRGTEDSTNNQTSQHTGSECVRNISPRSVLVCLVVLCVLLLTAVIVLCVLIYTNNTQFHIDNKNITQERDQLLTKNIKLTEERDQLRTDNIKLTDQKKQLLFDNKNLEKENQGLPTNINNLNKEKDQLTKQINGLLEILKPDGWIYYRSSIYFISSEKKSWSESRRYCRERGADLIIINNKEEQDFVDKISGSEIHWIGLFYSHLDSVWQWVDGSTWTSSFWACGEPNDQTNQKCMFSYIAYSYASPCYSDFKWICEKNLF